VSPVLKLRFSLTVVVLDVWAGFYLDGPVISEADLAPYVQDVLNELEFIMGDASTRYGGFRASLGYPEPIMQIKYVEIGNEDNLGGGLASYSSYRFSAFYDAIKNAYPDMNIIASTVDIDLPGNAMGDYHTYSRPDVLVSQFNQFDQNTSEHMTLISEYANIQLTATDQARLPFPNWIGTVAEAVYLIGVSIILKVSDVLPTNGERRKGTLMPYSGPPTLLYFRI
jgi:alpha-L-arabinofuranosidase